MVAVWPADLPSDVLRQGYDEACAPVKLRTQMDAGPPKQRRRFTAGVKPLTVVLSLTRAQVATLEAFHDDTLQGGALPFEWTHPRTLATVQFRFVDEPRWSTQSEVDWRATLALEVLP